MTTAASSAPAIEAVRRFNRFYTRRIGVLGEGLLGSPFSLAEGRVLYELAQRPRLTATDLIRELDLDAGYLSRMLLRLAQRGLLARRRSEHDGRQAHLSLTAQGRKAFAVLNRRSSRQVAWLIEPLPAAEKERLSGFMHSIRHLLADPAVKNGEVRLRGPKPGDLGWVVQRHGALYAQEYDWDQTFEALVARIAGDFGARHDPRCERCWIAELDGHPVGCVFLVRRTERIAKLRLLLVEPSARGRGVGRRLIAACVEFARSAGYRKVELWTNSVLLAARHLYEQAGFKRTHTDRHPSFGHDLVSETWVLDLA